ncbi:biotin/lipoyl-binding protein [Paraconexibacter antarcticus]|uniref:Biotin/lipoyl-binding protein n=1 Tax=Paraconexibacter antarcticus TaxID=2949664 RepID=A0ABY5DUI5_9ACTN|nr:biotin carboxylase N-terminal domain-containing protein [Paraconexibacter antarcticus]UTI64747.1 biotin/lipoyl-binding protein [Paraconexibacter antarcticus]
MTITRLLVANRGEIARRVFATCRRLGISTVAVYSEPDAGALFVREADVAVALGGATPAESYLRGDAVIAAALAAGADAIHPGYGFLSENAAFAAAVAEAGLVWVGPSPEAITAMGSKIGARERMEAAGVPVLPGAHLSDGEDVAAAAARVGFPLLVKASAGGGGKGMRVVASAEALAGAVEAAQREAGSAFGDATVFLERYAPRSRHVEVQLMGDAHGTVVALHERDCSVQRRHQKVIEEAPSPAVTPALRTALCDAAVKAGEALGYTGAGTVEFLLVLPDDGSQPTDFFFLEVNTRLQVEHPVTELVTGLDLVELQLHVAAGHPLPDAVHEAPLDGWAMEARLYAEDPANDFLPVTGTLSRFAVPDGVRVDTGVESGSEISPYYDPMIAKVIAHGATREEAARRLADALARAEVQGTVTNRDFLVRVLRSEAFLGGSADTTWLDATADVAALAAPLLGPDETRAAALAAALAGAAARRAEATVLTAVPSGWRNNPAVPQSARFATAHDEELEVAYRFDRTGRQLAEPEAVVLHRVTPELVELTAGGLRRTYRVGPDAVSTPDGEAPLRELPRFTDPSAQVAAGSLTSPMPGTVLRVLVEAGATVTAGTPLLVLEAMKMEHEIVAPADGVVGALPVAAGDQVAAGQVLAVIDGD